MSYVLEGSCPLREDSAVQPLPGDTASSTHGSQVAGTGGGGTRSPREHPSLLLPEGTPVISTYRWPELVKWPQTKYREVGEFSVCKMGLAQHVELSLPHPLSSSGWRGCFLPHSAAVGITWECTEWASRAAGPPETGSTLFSEVSDSRLLGHRETHSVVGTPGPQGVTCGSGGSQRGTLALGCDAQGVRGVWRSGCWGCDAQGVGGVTLRRSGGVWCSRCRGQWKPAQKGPVTTAQRSHPSEAPGQRYMIPLPWSYPSSQQTQETPTVVQRNDKPNVPTAHPSDLLHWPRYNYHGVKLPLVW